MKVGGIRVRLQKGQVMMDREDEVPLYLGCFPGRKEKSMPPSPLCKQFYQKEGAMDRMTWRTR